MLYDPNRFYMFLLFRPFKGPLNSIGRSELFWCGFAYKLQSLVCTIFGTVSGQKNLNPQTHTMDGWLGADGSGGGESQTDLAADCSLCRQWQPLVTGG